MANAQVSFFAPPSFSGSGQIFTGDFNTDGKPDILSADGELQLGRGDGSFASGTSLDRQVYAVADFNGDSKPDVLQLGNGTLLVRLGNGDGTFQAAISTNSGANLQLPAAGDLNGDGNAEVVGVFNNSLLVYISNGDGTFSTATSYPLGALPGSVLLLGDFNGDQKADVAVLTVGNNVAGEVKAFLGNGDGTLQAAQTSSGLLYPGSAVAGDFNGDGKQDLAVTGQVTTPAESVSILLGNNDGTFQSPTVAFFGAGSLATADLRGMGRPDLLVYSYPMIMVHPANGDGTFAPARGYMGLIASLRSIGAGFADFNLDGKVDVASGNAVLLGNGDGTLQGQPAVALSASGSATEPASADLNADHFPDLVVITQSPEHGWPNVVNVLLNDGTGALTPSNIYTIQDTVQINSLVAADVNQDGKPDLLIVGAAPGGSSEWVLFVLLGRGDGSFEDPVAYPYGTAPSSAKLITADFNNDSKPDLALLDGSGTSAMAVLLGNGDGTFPAPQIFFVGSAGILIAADLNSDGNVDIVAGGGGLQTATLLGNGDGTFRNADFSLGSFSAAVAGDFNGDHKVDLLGRVSNGMQVLLGNGDGTFQPLDSFSGSGTFKPADINGDGVLDLVNLTTGRNGALGVELGNGDGTFGSLVVVQSYFENQIGATSVSPTDMNQDQSMDLVLCEQSSTPGVYVLLNTTNPAPGVEFSPASVSFPTTPAGASSDPIPVTLTNTGAVVLTVSSVSINGADASQFSQTNNCGTIQPSASCTIQVRFSPTTEGDFVASLSVADNASGSPQSVPLSGTGTSTVDMGLSVPPGGSDSQTISAGDTATYTLSIGGKGWAGHVTLTCTGAPAGTTCSATPASLDVSATDASQLTVLVSTTSRMIAALTPASPTSVSWLWAVGVFTLAILPITVREARTRVWHLGGAVFLLLCLLAGCGGGSSHQGSGTPVGTYTLTLTATSGSIHQSLPLTLIVR